MLFYPGGGMIAESSAWQRNASRNLYFQMMDYIGTIKTHSVAHENVGFNLSNLERNQIHMSFGDFYNNYLYDDGLSAYPTNNTIPIPDKLPIVYLTKTKSPRIARSVIARQVDINLALARLVVEEQAQPNQVNNNRIRFDFILPETFKSVHDAMKMNPQKSSFAKLIFSPHTGPNVISIIAMRLYVISLCTVCNRGRNFYNDWGIVTSIIGPLCGYNIFQNTTFLNLFNDYKQMYTYVKNNGKSYGLQPWAPGTDFNNIQCIYTHWRNQCKNASCKKVLKDIFADIDRPAFHRLFMYSYTHGDDAPPPELQLVVPLQCTRVADVDEIDNNLRTCNNLSDWNAVKLLIVQKGVVTDYLCEAAIRLRIAFNTGLTDICAAYTRGNHDEARQIFNDLNKLFLNQMVINGNTSKSKTQE